MWRSSTTPTMTRSGQELVRQDRWADAVANGRVRAWLEDGAVVVAVTGPEVEVPLTLGPGARGADGAAFGTPYGTGRSAWAPVTGEQRWSTEERGKA